MAQNIEIKARANNFSKQLELAAQISDCDVQILKQLDTFFNVPNGRLKLREFVSAKAQLIYYHRSNENGPTLSDYHITETDDPAGLKNTLEKAYGISATVNKTRKLYMSGRTRIHMDEVDQLGTFIELEVVLAETEQSEVGVRESNNLMKLLCINEADLVDVAYVDLLMIKQ